MPVAINRWITLKMSIKPITNHAGHILENVPVVR